VILPAAVAGLFRHTGEIAAAAGFLFQGF